MANTIQINNTTPSAADVSKVNFPPNAPIDFGSLAKMFINLTPQSSPPSSPSAGDVYLDDGTNTVSGSKAFRRYNGTSWDDLGGGGASSLSNLTDVGTVTYTAGYYLRADGTDFDAGPIQAGDLPTGIDATKIGAGLVDNTEFGYLDGVTSAIQTQIDAKVATADLIDTSAGAADAGKPIKLDADGNIDATMINDADIDHGSISGLSDDDHTQYVHNTTARTITAVHTFNPATAGAPFALGANASGQLIAGLNADQLDGQDAPTGTIVGTTDIQTLTNKTLSTGCTVLGADDLPSTIANLLTDHNRASHDALGTGAMVFTDETQTLTAKTLQSPLIKDVAATPVGDVVLKNDSQVLHLRDSGDTAYVNLNVGTITPTAYGAQSLLDHGSISGLLDDDHTQYLLADGTRALAGNWDAGGYAISNVLAVTVATSIAVGQTVSVASGYLTQIALPTEHYPNGIVIDGVLQVDGGFLLMEV